MVCLALELVGPWVVLGFSVDMEAFDELLSINVLFSGRAGTHWGPGEPVAVLAHQWPSPKEGAVPSVSIFSSPDPSPCCPQRVPFLCPNWFPLICGGLGRQTSHICWKGISKKKLAWDSVLTGEL